MNKINNNLPIPDQAARGPSTAKLQDRSVSEGQEALPKTTAPLPVESKSLLSRTVARTETRHTLIITDKSYKAIVRNLCRREPIKRDLYIRVMNELGIKAGEPLPDDFPKRLMKTSHISLKEKQIILKRLEPELRQKWSTQTLKGELNAYQKQLDKEHGIDPADIKDQKFKAYQEKLAKQEFDMKSLFLVIEYGAKSESCATVIANNITNITNIFDPSYSKGREAAFKELHIILFSTQEDKALLTKVVEKATELYKETQKTAAFTPIMAQRARVTADKRNELIGILKQKDGKESVNNNDILSSLGIIENKPLPDDLTSRLFLKDISDEKKQIILVYFNDELSVKISKQAYIHKINVHERTLTTNPEVEGKEGFKTQLAKDHFQENLAGKLMEKKIKIDRLPLDQFENLKNCKNPDDVGDILTKQGMETEAANLIAGDVWSILEESKEIEAYSPPQLNEVGKAELKKVFTDPEILKILAFLQTDQTAVDREIIHYEGVKAKPEVIEELVSSPEFSEFMKGFEDIIFTNVIKNDFANKVKILGNPDALKADKKQAAKELKALEEKMINNVRNHLKEIGDKLQINENLDIQETKTAQKLTALLNVANGKNIATKDAFQIFKHRLLLGIKLATVSVFAAAALSVAIVGLIHVFIPLLAAMTIAIIVVSICSAFGIIGFSVGAWGSDEVREKYEKFMTHVKEMGTNMNVRQSESMATPLFAGL